MAKKEQEAKLLKMQGVKMLAVELDAPLPSGMPIGSTKRRLFAFYLEDEKKLVYMDLKPITQNVPAWVDEKILGAMKKA